MSCDKYALEAKWEKAQRPVQEEKGEGVAPDELGGMWRDGQGLVWQVTVTGSQISIRRENGANSQWYEGIVNVFNISGRRLQDFSWCRNGRLLKDPLSGTVSADGRTLTLQAGGEGPYEIGPNDTITRWFHYEDNQVFTKIE